MATIPFNQNVKNNILSNFDLLEPILATGQNLVNKVFLDVGATQAGYTVTEEAGTSYVTFSYVLDSDNDFSNGGLLLQDRFGIDKQSHRLSQFSRSVSGNTPNALWIETLNRFREQTPPLATQKPVKDFYKRVVLRLPFEEDNDTAAELSLHQAAVQVYPKSAEAHYQLGLALQMNLEREKAITEFRKAIQLDPQNSTLYAALAFSLSLDGASAGEAIVAYQRSLELDSQNAENHFHLGLIFYEQGNSEKAAQEWQASLQLKANDAATHFYLGMLLYEKGDLEGAALKYYDALRLQPHDSDYLGSLGMVLSQQADQI